MHLYFQEHSWYVTVLIIDFLFLFRSPIIVPATKCPYATTRQWQQVCWIFIFQLAKRSAVTPPFAMRGYFLQCLQPKVARQQTPEQEQVLQWLQPPQLLTCSVLSWLESCSSCWQLSTLASSDFQPMQPLTLSYSLAANCKQVFVFMSSSTSLFGIGRRLLCSWRLSFRITGIFLPF